MFLLTKENSKVFIMSKLGKQVWNRPGKIGCYTCYFKSEICERCLVLVVWMRFLVTCNKLLKIVLTLAHYFMHLENIEHHIFFKICCFKNMKHVLSNICIFTGENYKSFCVINCVCNIHFTIVWCSLASWNEPHGNWTQYLFIFPMFLFNFNTKSL